MPGLANLMLEAGFPRDQGRDGISVVSSLGFGYFMVAHVQGKVVRCSTGAEGSVEQEATRMKPPDWDICSPCHGVLACSNHLLGRCGLLYLSPLFSKFASVYPASS